MHDKSDEYGQHGNYEKFGLHETDYFEHESIVRQNFCSIKNSGLQFLAAPKVDTQVSFSRNYWATMTAMLG